MKSSRDLCLEQMRGEEPVFQRHLMTPPLLETDQAWGSLELLLCPAGDKGPGSLVVGQGCEAVRGAQQTRGTLRRPWQRAGAR